MLGAATAKLREPKHVRTRGTDSKLETDERKLQRRQQRRRWRWRDNDTHAASSVVVSRILRSA